MIALIGHKEALATVQQSIRRGTFSHAYLITGPRGVGRRTFALEIAKALNCEAAPSARPCGLCRACRHIERGIHPDVRLIKRAPDRREIYLRPQSDSDSLAGYRDYVRWIQSDAYLRPAEGRSKVYLILNAEALREDAADRLLKIIEEPPPFVTFLLTASERGVVKPTVASRTQEIRLKTVAPNDLAAALVSSKIASAELAARLAALSGGKPGWALAAIEKPDALVQHETAIKLLAAVIEGSRLQRLVCARTLSEQWPSKRDSVTTTLSTWLAWFRDAQLVQLGLGERAVHTEAHELATLTAVAQHVSPQQVRATELLLQQSLEDLATNVNPRLVLDLLLLKLPQVKA